MEGDENAVLKDGQFDLYWRMINEIVRQAQEAHKSAMELLECEAALEEAAALTRFDHRTIQGTHDLMLTGAKGDENRTARENV